MAPIGPDRLSRKVDLGSLMAWLLFVGQRHPACRFLLHNELVWVVIESQVTDVWVLGKAVSMVAWLGLLVWFNTD